MPKNFKLIVITSEKEVDGEITSINDLFKTGLELLHIRKPNYSVQETEKLLKSISTVFHPRIVLHNHYVLLNRYNLKGSHLPENIRKEADFKTIKNIISTSFHSHGDVLVEKNNFEYAFFSPVFQSISKEGYKPSVEPTILKDFFRSNKNQIPFPIIALGGITDKNILQAKDMGFNGAACIGYIWGNPNPVEQFHILQRIV